MSESAPAEEDDTIHFEDEELPEIDEEIVEVIEEIEVIEETEDEEVEEEEKDELAIRLQGVTDPFERKLIELEYRKEQRASRRR